MKAKRLSDQLGESKEAGEFRPQLTSLIDVMTILLVFLMQNFSTDINLSTDFDNLTVPSSSIEAEPVVLITVSITTDALFVDGDKIVSLDQFALEDEYEVPELFQRMEIERAKVEYPQMMLQADKELPFNIIKRVAFTCNRAGFSDFSILVFQEDK